MAVQVKIYNWNTLHYMLYRNAELTFAAARQRLAANLPPTRLSYTLFVTKL